MGVDSGDPAAPAGLLSRGEVAVDEGPMRTEALDAAILSAARNKAPWADGIQAEAWKALGTGRRLFA